MQGEQLQVVPDLEVEGGEGDEEVEGVPPVKRMKETPLQTPPEWDLKVWLHFHLKGSGHIGDYSK